MAGTTRDCSCRLAFVDPASSPVRGRTPACIALGSNLGDRDAHLCAAILALRHTVDTEVVAVSKIYETDPVGPPPQGPYLNAVVCISTGLTPEALLDRLQQIESERGRRRSAERNNPRTLDLDLLLFGDARIDLPGLIVPHPRLHERAFVLEPLRDVAANWRHPVLGEAIEVLARRARDRVRVRRLEGSWDTGSDKST